jgi:hypothetical protein
MKKEPEMGYPKMKPMICQAGSAEAFAGSSAINREQHCCNVYWNAVK